MVDPVAEQLIREKACFFVKGKMPDVLRSNIPNSAFKKGMTYILAIIEVDEFEGEYIEDSEGGVNLNKLTPIEDRYANYVTQNFINQGKSLVIKPGSIIDIDNIAGMSLEEYKEWRDQIMGL